MSDTRSRFEELMHEQWISPTNLAIVGEDYLHPDVQRWYEIFQAAEAQAVRRCVEIIQAPERTCCGRFVVGASYMGQNEMICCGEPDEDEQTLDNVVAAIRAAFPHVKE